MLPLQFMALRETVMVPKAHDGEDQNYIVNVMVFMAGLSQGLGALLRLCITFLLPPIVFNPGYPGLGLMFNSEAASSPESGVQSRACLLFPAIS